MHMNFGKDKLADDGIQRSSSSDLGFRVVESVLSRKDCEGLLGSLERCRVTRGRAGARHLMGEPAIARLAHDARLIRLAQTELGGKAVPFRATLFEKSGKANWLVVWHQDTALPIRERFEAAGWGPWSEKAGVLYSHSPAWALSRVVALRVHLDASTSNNGPLRVVPDSHTLGVLTDEEIRSVVNQRGFSECLVSIGGILVMRPLLIHASSKALAEAPRRVLHIEYSDSLILAPDIELAVT